ncbi:protease inhibitor I42 family protein [Deinococcus roseus]|uniref:Proteinase inhibitor I42 chagasin domain-containing protein n=1 Tax=Deinococcus roseus TaxID=392414 RepID=A0ABQ2D7R9_9DEIO|nr:protease inhibitor I42 family protein [Deinococcus roseus]GGJ46770.1 hypothetical protein GCM10008938_36170 [Deinococcus roseus]
MKNVQMAWAAKWLKVLVVVLLPFGAGPAWAGGGSSLQQKITDVGEDAASITLHAGEVFRVHLQETPNEDGRSWYALNELNKVRLVRRESTPLGDHGYLSTVSDITYTYRVLPRASGEQVLVFVLARQNEKSGTVLRWLTIKIIP